MRRWTGRWPVKNASKTPWPPGIWPMGRWCSMTCPRRRSRAAPARWGRSGTPATGSKAGARSSTGCCAPPRGCRWPSRCSRATPPTPKPWPARSPSSRPGSGCSGCAWSVIGACSPMRASATSCGRPSWIGSAPCGPRRSRPCSRTARCSCRCSTSRTSSRSLPGLSRGAAGVLPQPGIGRGPRPHPPRAARGHRKRTGQDRRGHPPPAPTVARARTRSPCGWAR